MKSCKRATVNVLVTGVVVIILMSLGLFWARWLCALQRADLLAEADRKATVALPLSLSSMRAGEDPNVRFPRYLAAEMAPRPPSVTCLFGLGAVQYVEQHLPGGPGSDVYRWNSQPDGISVYYDRSLGLIVYQGLESHQQRADGRPAWRWFACYAGPEGIGEKPEEKLGRFTSPVADRSMLHPQIVYDPVLRRFFAIEWSEQKLRQGPPLLPNDTHEPVQIRTLQRFPVSLDLVPNVTPRETQRDRSVLLGAFFSTGDRLLVLDRSGRVDLLDSQTLTFVGMAGRLGSPAPLFGFPRPTRPEDVLSYTVSPIGISRGTAGQGRTYAGCAVATISREATGLRLDVYDANGQSVGGDDMGLRPCAETADGKITRGQSIPSTKAAYSHLPGAQVLTLAKFTLENLHPPVFLLASYLDGPHVAATTGYRSLFLLPDSFVAMSARDAHAGRIERASRAFLLALPAFLLSLLLAWRVTCDGARLGLSKNARAAWVAGTVALGLPAYLTYRLTRPRVTLVTCANCGLSRRPDREKCQRCGSPWAVPELVPPAWRVMGEQEPAEENSPAPAPPAKLQSQ
jgi:hypothetical protein